MSDTIKHTMTRGEKIAAAIADHLHAHDVRYADRARALESTYATLVRMIDEALIADGQQVTK